MAEEVTWACTMILGAVNGHPWNHLTHKLEVNGKSDACVRSSVISHYLRTLGAEGIPSVCQET